MPDTKKLIQNGEKSIGIVEEGGIGIYLSTFISNPDLNKIPFMLPENGIFFYSYQFPRFHSFFKNKIIFYFLVIIASLILVLPLLKLETSHEAIVILTAFVAYTALNIIQAKTQKNILKKGGISLNKKNPILFQNIRKIKKEGLILKIYLKQKVYPEYMIYLKNDDQVDALIESFEYWIQSNKTENNS
jgi:hypothetical protein